MSASAAGTKDKPGKGVRAKAGLNRSILDASPFELRRQLEYKTAWRGGWLVPVAALNTSRICPRCDSTTKDNRKTQAEFLCVACGFSENADLVGAINIQRLGIASLACKKMVNLGAKQMYFYPGMKVIFTNGKVSDVQ